MKSNRMRTITLVLILLLGAGMALLSLRAQLLPLLWLSLLLAGLWSGLLLWAKLNWHVVFFAAFLVLISTGIFVEMPFGWMALAICVDIAAWNLGEFTRRLEQSPNIHNRRALEKRHLAQVALPLGIGFALAMLPTVIRMELPFVVLVILVIAAVVLVGVGIRGLRE